MRNLKFFFLSVFTFVIYISVIPMQAADSPNPFDPHVGKAKITDVFRLYNYQEQKHLICYSKYLRTEAGIDSEIISWIWERWTKHHTNMQNCLPASTNCWTQALWLTYIVTEVQYISNCSYPWDILCSKWSVFEMKPALMMKREEKSQVRVQL